MGANGAGKTTLLRTISGLQPVTRGSIRFGGRDITAHARARRRVAEGIAQVPEGRQVFGPMSVEDNLVLGAYTRGRGAAVNPSGPGAHVRAASPYSGRSGHEARGKPAPAGNSRCWPSPAP
ncbi:MAG: ATP-binding cassette domain-containing protein [Arhodomonas sp.]|nr:ATP-binding cassette domain-containing protein [Arhodomonas sp.]